MAGHGASTAHEYLASSLQGLRFLRSISGQHDYQLDISDHLVTDSAQVKVLLQEDDNVETLWAERVGPDQYKLDNSPFWAYGVSWRDVIEARPDADGMLTFVRVIQKSGHRTVRLILKPPADKSSESQAILEGVVALGASYEGMHPQQNQGIRPQKRHSPSPPTSDVL